MGNVLRYFLPNLEEKDRNGRTRLSRAVWDGNDREVAQLRAKGANVETRDADGLSPLSIASGRGHKGIVQLLFAKELVIEARDSAGLTPLSIASLEGHAEIVQLLLDYGADIETKSHTCFGPLHLAVQEGHETIVRQLLQKCPDIEAKTLDGFTVLSIACFEGHAGIVQLLLESRADTETRCNKGFFPLYLAAQEGHEQIVRLLLNRGADLEARSSGGHTAMSIACSEGQVGVVRLLLESKANIETRGLDGFTPLSLATYKGHVGVVQLLLEFKADIQTKSNMYACPLQLAAQGGHEQIVSLLLDGRADIEAKNTIGDTPLSLASFKGHIGIVQLLLDSGADIETKDNEGFFPLYNAAQEGHKQIVRLLLISGAHTETRVTSCGFTALSKASEMGIYDIVQMLLARGASIEARDELGRTPLAVARIEGHLEVANLLGLAELNKSLLIASEQGNEKSVSMALNSGAYIETKYDNGNTPLCKASFNGHCGVIEQLLEAGANVEAKTDDGYFPLYFAAENNHPNVTLLLLMRGATIDGHTASPLHVSSQCGHTLVVDLLLKEANIERKDKAGRTPLVTAAMFGQTDVIKLLIKRGADYESRDNDGLSALEISVIHGQVNTVKYFMNRIPNQNRGAVAEQMVSLSAEYGQKRVISFFAHAIPRLSLNHRDINGLSPFAKAVACGHFDCVRLLHSLGAKLTATEINECRSVHVYEYFLIVGLYDSCPDSRDTKLHEYLCFGKDVDWSIFESTLSLGNSETIHKNSVSSFVNIKGVGSVMNPNGRTCNDNEVLQAVYDKICSMTKQVCERWKIEFPELVGSCAESSKVGLLDEMDFKFRQGHDVFTDQIEDVGHGFRKYIKEELRSNSKLFHSAFWEDIPLVEDDMVISLPTAVAGDGSASTPLMMVWPSKHAPCRLVVSIDLVPTLHVVDWPNDAIQKTWMMNREALQENGYELVAKPPCKSSRFGERFSAAEREKLYTISFANLEVAHIKLLKPWVKDAFILAKCVRNPIVCKTVVRDDDGVIHFVDTYITTYFLKNVFLLNVEDFLQREGKPLIDMTYIIYSHLEYYLLHGFVPLFWMPKINMLEGRDINAAKSHKVAKHIKSFLAKAYKDELNKDPPGDVNDKTLFSQDCKRIDLGDASNMQILSVPLTEEAMRTMFVPRGDEEHNEISTVQEVISSETT